MGLARGTRISGLWIAVMCSDGLLRMFRGRCVGRLSDAQRSDINAATVMAGFLALIAQAGPAAFGHTAPHRPTAASAARLTEIVLSLAPMEPHPARNPPVVESAEGLDVVAGATVSVAAVDAPTIPPAAKAMDVAAVSVAAVAVAAVAVATAGAAVNAENNFGVRDNGTIVCACGHPKCGKNPVRYGTILNTITRIVATGPEARMGLWAPVMCPDGLVRSFRGRCIGRLPAEMRALITGENIIAGFEAVITRGAELHPRGTIIAPPSAQRAQLLAATVLELKAAEPYASRSRTVPRQWGHSLADPVLRAPALTDALPRYDPRSPVHTYAKPYSRPRERPRNAIPPRLTDALPRYDPRSPAHTYAKPYSRPRERPQNSTPRDPTPADAAAPPAMAAPPAAAAPPPASISLGDTLEALAAAEIPHEQKMRIINGLLRGSIA
jgi:hypothetical protein